VEFMNEGFQSDPVVKAPPEYRFHSVGQITLAAFLGAPLPGFWLASRNFKALGRKKEARKSLYWGVGLTVAAMTIAGILPERFPAMAISLPFIVVSHSIAKQWFAHDLVEHITLGGRMASWWVSVAAGLTSLMIILGLVFGVSMLETDEDEYAELGANMTAVKSDDAEMNQAMQTARDKFPEFWREVSADYKRPIPVLDNCMVKAYFNDPNGAKEGPEHMWVTDLEYDGKLITGTLSDIPHHLRSVKRGQDVSFPIERLSDWIYVKNGKAVGGFTIHLLRSRMSESERKAHDDAYPFRFE
jgi:uncharacterized protein YegJ (DUF2314 family)